MKMFSRCALLVCVLANAFAGILHADDAKKPLDLGDLAPDFSFVDFENKEHKLSEFRGKNVLLDVWATWCGPCIGEIPSLRKIHEEFKDNEKFVVLSVSIDEKFETAKNYITKNNMLWVQGHASGAWKSEVVKKYGIDGIPSIWLIGADGRIMAMDTRGEESLKTVRLLLAGELKINTTPEPDVTVTGKVVDDAGNPVKGATALISASRQAKDGRAKKSFWNKKAVTNEDGIWTYKMFPKAENVSLGVYHHEYDSTGGYSYFPIDVCKSIPDFYAGKTEFVLKRGAKIYGVVKDRDGKPLAKASVQYGQDNQGSNALPPIYTDEKGTFVLGTPLGSTAWITVKAKGFAPDLQKISVDLNAAKANCAFILKPACTLEGIVVDAQGTPIKGAYVYFDRWRDARTLSAHAKVKNNGTFEWKGAPEDEVTADADARGYVRVSGVKLKAGDKNVITLIKETPVVGKVIDSETGELIKEYEITIGMVPNAAEPERIWWQENSNSETPEIGADGSFRHMLVRDYAGYLFRISAIGYKPEISEQIPVDGKMHEIVIKLRKGQSLPVKITDSLGNPLSGTEIAILTKDTPHLQVKDGALNKYWARDYKHFTTGDDGIFLIPPQLDPYRLLVLHKSAGIAQLKSQDIVAEQSIVLTPWQRISGAAFVGENSSTGTTVYYQYVEKLFYMEFPTDHEVRCEAEAVTDENGNFEITHALPGYGFLNNGKQSKVIRVTVGDAQKIVFGGKGRPVEGRFVVPDGLKAKVGFFRSGSMELQSPQEEQESDDSEVAEEIQTERKKESDYTPEELAKMYQDHFE